MGKSDASDSKKEEKKAKKRAKKAKKEAKRLKKEQKQKKRREKEAQSKEESPQKRPSEAKQPQSVFYKKRIEISISLLPAAMGNIRAALEDSIRSMLLKYTDKVGILLTFGKVQIISNNGHGRILDELPHLHYKVGFDGLVFCPEVGCKLQGTVTESFPSHLGMLVLGYFNTMIPSSCLTKAGFSFDEDLHEWSKEDGSTVLTKDDRVDFTVDKIHESLGTVSMEGSEPSLSPFNDKLKAAAQPIEEEEYNHLLA